ncbi:glycoside hydrolase family 2 [Vibrio mimicus]
MKDFDPTRRLIHYEGAQGDPNHSEYKPMDAYYERGHEYNKRYIDLANPIDPPFVDVISRMYPTLAQLEGLATSPYISRPILMCEYAHAMGNSLGNLAKLWDLVWHYDNLIGGFVWDWIDQGLVKTLSSGEQYVAYGGVFSDKPNNGNFCINGIVGSFRNPKPTLYEAKYVFQPVRFQVLNLLQTGQFSVKPSSARLLNLKLNRPNLRENAQYYLHFSLVQKQANEWVPAGYVVAEEEFKLPWEMAEQNQLFLNIDFVHSGIGSNDIWSLNAEPLKQYQIKSGSYRFNLRISPDTNSL